jgi:hypothetical protein
MDVDIIIDSKMPKDFTKSLNVSFIYGSMRRIFDDIEYFKDGVNWDILRNNKQAKIQYIGNCPYAQVGYFQMFHKKGCRFNTKYQTASDCDTDFFHDNFNLNLTQTFNPELLICYHLGPIEQNWSGRVTKEWAINA